MSVAVHTTGVVPASKALSEGGLQVTVESATLSVTVGLKLTTALPWALATAFWLEGHVIKGGVASCAHNAANTSVGLETTEDWLRAEPLQYAAV